MNSIGFVGLGKMGLPMVTNFLRRTTVVKEVLLFDSAAGRVESFVKSFDEHDLKRMTSIRNVGNVAELARHCDAIVTMLPTTDAVLDVCQNHIFPYSRPNSLLVIDCSTVSPMASRQLALQAQNQYHIDFVDAPVSGGVAGATAGTLTFMVGADDIALFETAQSLLTLMGKKVIHTGGTGTGSTVKLCNNLALAIETIAISEAMNLGIKSGVDAKVLADAMSSSTAACWSSTVNNPCPGVVATAPSSHNYVGGFISSLMVKDLKLALLAAREVNVEAPIGQATLDLYHQMIKHNESCSKKDFSVIYEFISKGLR